MVGPLSPIELFVLHRCEVVLVRTERWAVRTLNRAMTCVAARQLRHDPDIDACAAEARELNDRLAADPEALAAYRIRAARENTRRHLVELLGRGEAAEAGVADVLRLAVEELNLELVTVRGSE